MRRERGSGRWLRRLCTVMLGALALWHGAADLRAQDGAGGAASWTGDERRAIQESLIWSGHYFGLIDGDFGTLTRTAISDWQADAGFAPTGTLTQDQVARLVASAAALRSEIGFTLQAEPNTGVTFGLPAEVMNPFPQVLDQYGVEYRAQDGEASISLSTFPCPGSACWESVHIGLEANIADIAYSFRNDSRVSVNGRAGTRYLVYFGYRRQGSAALIQLSMPAGNRLWLAVAMANGTYIDPFGARTPQLVPLGPPGPR